MEATGGVLVLAHHLTAVVDVERLAGDRTRNIELDMAAAVQQEPAELSAGDRRVRGVAVDAHDLAAVVDPLGLSPLGTGHVDRGEPAPVQPEAVLRHGRIGIAADDLTLVVYVERRDALRREILQTARGRDRLEPSAPQQETGGRSAGAAVRAGVGAWPGRPGGLHPYRGFGLWLFAPAAHSDRSGVGHGRSTPPRGPSGAVEGPSLTTGVRHYQRTESRTGEFAVTWYDQFPGGCVTSQLHLMTDPNGELAGQAPHVLGFRTRAELQEALSRRSDGRLQLDPEEAR